MLHFFAKRLREIHEKDEQGQKGFTLIELLVVVIIIGILAAIAIPTFLAQRKNAYEAQTKTDVRTAVTNSEAHATSNNGSYATVTTDIAKLNAEKNTTIVVSAAAANEFKVQGTNKTNTDVIFCYTKSTDTLATGACT